MGFELDRLMKQYGVGSAAIASYAPPPGGAPKAPAELRAQPEKPTSTTTPMPGSVANPSASNYAKDLEAWNKEKKKYDADMAAYRAALEKYNASGAAYEAGKPAYDAYVAEYQRRVQNTPMYNQQQFVYGNYTPTWNDQLAPFKASTPVAGGGSGAGNTGGNSTTPGDNTTTGGGTTPGGDTTTPGGTLTPPNTTMIRRDVVNWLKSQGKTPFQTYGLVKNTDSLDQVNWQKIADEFGISVKNDKGQIVAAPTGSTAPLATTPGTTVPGAMTPATNPGTTTPGTASPGTTPPAQTAPNSTTLVDPNNYVGLVFAPDGKAYVSPEAAIASGVTSYSYTRNGAPVTPKAGYARGGGVETEAVEAPDIEMTPVTRSLDDMAASYGEGSPDALANMIEILQNKNYAQDQEIYDQYLAEAEKAAAAERMSVLDQEYQNSPSAISNYVVDDGMSDEEYLGELLKMYENQDKIRQERAGNEVVEVPPENIYVDPTEFDGAGEEYIIDAAATGKKPPPTDVVKNPFVKNAGEVQSDGPETAGIAAPLAPSVTDTDTTVALYDMLSKYMPNNEAVYAKELEKTRGKVEEETKAFEALLKQAILSPEDAASNKAEMYFRLAAAFGSPTKTGNFFENLSLAGKEMADVKKGERETAAGRRKLLLEGQKIKMDAAKDDLTAIRAMAGREAQDKSAMAREMIKAYIESGKPQSSAGKQAQDEGLVIGTPEFKKRVSEIAALNIEKQMAAINASLVGAQAAQQNAATAARNAETAKEKEKRTAKKLSPKEIEIKKEAEDLVANGQQALKDLAEAYRLNPNTLGGSLLDKAQQAIYEAAGSKDPTIINTRIVNNLLSAQGLAKLRATFGGNPTEGERAILLELEGIGSKTKEERGAIIKRAYKVLQERIEREQQRLQKINKGEYGTTTPGEEE